MKYILIGLIVLSGCGREVEFRRGEQGLPGANGLQGEKGDTGAQGMGAGVMTEALLTGDVNCPTGNGGTKIVTFLDPYNTGVYQSGDTVTSTSFVCDGANGDNGATGAKGDKGNKGDKGDNGVNGTNGTNGSSSVVSIAAASVAACPHGGQTVTVTNGSNPPTSASVCNGAQGTQGVQGNTGLQGATGAAGTPGTIVTPVKFCPGNTTYSSKFVEYGLCITNNLYGVYSENDGFWTIIPPGTYSSEGINSSCHFTVSVNCQVEN